MEQQQAATGGKYRKKPVVIEAFQIPPDDGGPHDAPPWMVVAITTGAVTACDGGGVDITTKEGTMHGNVGDWIIRGVQGELYPCAPDIFALTYDDAGEESVEKAPDATIAITWNGTGFDASVQRQQDLNQPAAHLSDWIGRHLQPLTMMAAIEWSTRNEQASAQAAPEAGLRLISPHGGPLQ